MLSNDWAAIKKCRCHLSPAVAALLLASHPLSSLTEPHYIHIYIYSFYLLFIDFWLHWTFVAALRLSLVTVNRVYSLGTVHGLLTAVTSLVLHRPWGVQVSLVAARRLTGIFLHVGFSWIRDQTDVPRIARQILLTSGPPGKPRTAIFKNTYFYFFDCTWSQLWHGGSLIIVAVSRIFRWGMRTLSCALWDLVPQPGMEPRPPSLGGQDLSPLDHQESLHDIFLDAATGQPQEADIFPFVGCWLLQEGGHAAPFSAGEALRSHSFLTMGVVKAPATEATALKDKSQFTEDGEGEGETARLLEDITKLLHPPWGW